MMTRKIRLNAGMLSCLAALLLIGCSKGVTHDTSPTSDPNSQSATVTPSPATQAKPTTSARTPGGDPIDMTELDGKVQLAEKNLSSGPGDEAARLSLAHAYLARASALTKARQYRSALGDYRRTLKLEPTNKEASNMSATIISILNEMNIPVPAEGQEPPPKPLTDSSQSTEGSTKKSY